MLEFGPWKKEEGLDIWRDTDTCSFCGSLKPEKVITLILNECQVVPTDKSYKGYIYNFGRTEKFYFQHFSEDQQMTFISLLNDKKINIGYPGHFYVLPFFVTKVEK